MAQTNNVMERQALIIEHDVVCARYRDDEVHAGIGKREGKQIHIVLIGFGMVGVAHIDTHRQTKQLAAEMVFKSGADDFLGIVKVFRPDEANDRIDEQG